MASSKQALRLATCECYYLKVSILYSTSDDGDIVSRGNSCLHTFHSDCLQCWMKKQPSCPCCRQNIMEEASYCGEEDSLIENETWARLVEILKESMSMLSISWWSQWRARQRSGSYLTMMCSFLQLAKVYSLLYLLTTALCSSTFISNNLHVQRRKRLWNTKKLHQGITMIRDAESLRLSPSASTLSIMLAAR